MRNTFKRYERIKKNDDFTIVFKQGKKYSSEKVAFFVLKNNLGFSRLGVAFVKDIKFAVRRNYLKRIAREIFRNNKNLFKQSYDVVVLFKHELSYKELKDFFYMVFKSEK
jgi:ribonuclease P protein component